MSKTLPGTGRNYLLQLYRYIELNPVRAKRVEQPSDYVWSSYAVNALGKLSNLCTPHSLYLALGGKPKERRSNYRELFKHHIDGKLLEEIRLSVNKGMAIGNERFTDEIERLTGRRMKEKKWGGL